MIYLDQKIKFSMFLIAVVAMLQGIAWYLGYNGQVFAFTSLIIGLTAGSVLGFSFRHPVKTS